MTLETRLNALVQAIGLDMKGKQARSEITATGRALISATTAEAARLAIGITGTGGGTSNRQAKFLPENYYPSGGVAGTSADGEAIQNAINAAQAASPNGGGQVELKPGVTYISVRQIVVHGGVTLDFNGAKVSGGSSALAAAFKLQDSRSVILNPYIIADINTVCGIVFAGGAQYCKIKGGYISGLQGVAIDAAGVDHVVIDDVDFRACTYGILTNSKSVDLQDVRVTRCTFDDIISDPIELNHPGTDGTGGSEFIISGNWIRARMASDTSNAPGATSGGFGVGVAHCKNVTIEGNIFVNCRQEGVHLEDTASEITITGNTFLNCYNGIWALGVRTVTVTGNTFRGGTWGIKMTYDPTHYVQGAVVNGNTFVGQATTGLLFQSNQNPYANLGGNLFQDIPGRGIEVDVPAGSTYYTYGNVFQNITGGAERYVTGQPTALAAGASSSGNFNALATAPVSPSAGWVYFDTGLKLVRVYDGTGWKAIAFIPAPVAGFIGNPTSGTV